MAAAEVKRIYFPERRDDGFGISTKWFSLRARGVSGVVGAVLLAGAIVVGYLLVGKGGEFAGKQDQILDQHALMLKQLEISNYLHAVTDPKELNEMRWKLKRPEGL